MKKFVLQFFLSLAFIYVVLILAVFLNQRSLMYFPQPAISDEIAKNILPQVEIIQVITEDKVELKAYLIPPKDKLMPIILAFHGNGALALHLADKFKPIIQSGYGVLFAEYRGYGGNQGKPTEEGLYKDADAYLEYITHQFPEYKIVAYGQSLGSAVAVDIVHRNSQDFSALIMEVPFDSALSVADKSYSFIPFKNILLKDKYESSKKIIDIQIPKLFLIAGQDEVVGIETGQNLFNLAPYPKKIYVYGEAKHNNVEFYGASRDTLNFLATIK